MQMKAASSPCSSALVKLVFSILLNKVNGRGQPNDWCFELLIYRYVLKPPGCFYESQYCEQGVSRIFSVYTDERITGIVLFLPPCNGVFMWTEANHAIKMMD